MGPTPENKEAIAKAVNFLVQRLKPRLERDKVAWYVRADTHDAVRASGLSARGFSAVYKRVAVELGVTRLDHRNNFGEETSTLMTLLEMTNGELNDAVREEFRRKHPDRPITGPLVKAARIRLGLTKESNGAAAAPTVIEMEGVNDAFLMLGHYEKLLKKRLGAVRQIEALEEEKGHIENELARYKPIVAAVEALKNASRRIKDDQQQAAVPTTGPGELK